MFVKRFLKISSFFHYRFTWFFCLFASNFHHCQTVHYIRGVQCRCIDLNKLDTYKQVIWNSMLSDVTIRLPPVLDVYIDDGRVQFSLCIDIGIYCTKDWSGNANVHVFDSLVMCLHGRASQYKGVKRPYACHILTSGEMILNEHGERKAGVVAKSIYLTWGDSIELNRRAIRREPST